MNYFLRNSRLLLNGIEYVLNPFRGDVFPMRSMNIDDVVYAIYLTTWTTSYIVLIIRPQIFAQGRALKYYHLGKCFAAPNGTFISKSR